MGERKRLWIWALVVLLFVGGMVMIALPARSWNRQIDGELLEYEELKALQEEPEDKGTQQEAPSDISPEGEDEPEKREETGTEVKAEPKKERAKESRPKVDWDRCLAINPDCAAWIQIPGTPIDYPVVKTDDPDYALTHTFSGAESAVGMIFSLDDVDYKTPGKNIAIYGHHMRNREKMFTPLLRYKSPEFYEGHRTVYLDTPEQQRSYQVFAVVNMSIGDWNPGKTDFADDGAFFNFAQRAAGSALYETGVEVSPEDRIVTLITCDRSYGGKDGRLIVMAVEKEGDE